jgi:hypothetical protein
MRRLVQLGLPALTAARFVSADAFLKTVADIQALGVKDEMKREAARRIKALYETEQLDLNMETGFVDMKPDEAGQIAQAASQKSVSASRSPVLQGLYDWALAPQTVDSLSKSPVALSRLLHSAIVLRAPVLYELTFTYLRSLIPVIPSLEPQVCAVITNVYGRCGIRHGQLFEALELRLIETIKDPVITLAHVANVAQALSKVQQPPKGSYNKKLYLALRDQAVRLHAQATPLMLVTILDSFASVGYVDDEVSALYESRLVACIEECSPILLGAILQTCVKSNRTTSALFDSVAAVARKKIKDFDSVAIATVLDAFSTAQRPNEELFALAAEQACKQVMHFRSNEIAMTLRALAAFDLFDAELFPLMASRFTAIASSSEIACEDAVTVLEAFAMVHERNEALLNVANTIIQQNWPLLTPAHFVTALWAFDKLNYRSAARESLIGALQTAEGAARLQRVPSTPAFAARVAEVSKYCSVIPDAAQTS